MVEIDSSTAAKPFRGRTRHRQWEQLSRGVYVPRASPLRDLLLGWQLVLPSSAAFTSLTAAEVGGWWLPEAIPHPVFAAVPIGKRYPERTGLLVSRHSRPVPVETVRGLTLTTGAETLLAAARDLGLLDLVILGDSALRCGHCTLRDLRATAAQRRRGAPRLRAVLPLLDARSESPWESVMRVLHQAAEINVEPQKKIYDQRGRFVARADLWLVRNSKDFMSTTGVSIATAWCAQRPCSGSSPRRDRLPTNGVSLQPKYFTKPPRSSPPRTGCLVGAGIRDGSHAGEALLGISLFRPAGQARAIRHWERAL